MKNLAVVTWTHTEMEDVFPVYFGNLKKYFPEHRSCNNYILIDKLNENISDDYTQLVNNENDTYASRWLGCLEYIKEDYFLYLQEDFILFDEVNVSEFERCLNYLKNSDCSCIRFVRSNNSGLEHKKDSNIYQEKEELYFTQVSSIWKKEHFIEVMEKLNPKTFRDLESGGSFAASRVMKDLGYYSSFYFDESSNRRKLFETTDAHWDDMCFPHTLSSIYSGRWNMQYSKEINKFSKEYNINISSRGTIH